MTENTSGSSSFKQLKRKLHEEQRELKSAYIVWSYRKTCVEMTMREIMALNPTPLQLFYLDNLYYDPE